MAEARFRSDFRRAALRKETDIPLAGSLGSNCLRHARSTLTARSQSQIGLPRHDAGGTY